MPRKNNRNNPLQVKIRPATLPKSVTSIRYFKTLLEVIDGEREELPPQWEVRMWWRNPETKKGLTKHWRDDDFVSAVNESRQGFVDITRGLIQRSLKREELKRQMKRQKRKGKK